MKRTRNLWYNPVTVNVTIFFRFSAKYAFSCLSCGSVKQCNITVLYYCIVDCSQKKKKNFTIEPKVFSCRYTQIARQMTMYMHLIIILQYWVRTTYTSCNQTYAQANILSNSIEGKCYTSGPGLAEGVLRFRSRLKNANVVYFQIGRAHV